MAQSVKNLPTMQETQIRPLGGDPLEKETAACLLQYSCLGNPMGRGACRATVHGGAKSLTRLSDQAQHSTAEGQQPKLSAGALHFRRE